MAKLSAGIIAYRQELDAGKWQVLLVHPGGPLWKNKDEGAWSIPKGEYAKGENAFVAALREFEEETGNHISGEAIFLTPVKLKSGKLVSAWAIQADFEQCFISSNHFEMEWPPRSGKMQSFAEVDKAGWFTLEEARKKLNPAQVSFIDELEQILSELPG